MKFLIACCIIAALVAMTGTRSDGPKPAWAQAAVDHQHDFDFEFGHWAARLRLLSHRLAGSNDWVTYEGTSVVRKVWAGRANLGELEVGNGTDRIEALTLRIYDRKSKMWNIYFANAKAGSLDIPPMVGRFNGNRGEFYDTENYHGKPTRVRFVFSNITQRSFDFVQSFSSDAGKTWEDNWVANFTRQ